MQPREVIATVLSRYGAAYGAALDTADEMIERLGVDGYEIVSRGWRYADPKEFTIEKMNAGPLTVMSV